MKRSICDRIGWLLCEIAFLADCRFGTAALYRAGCWFYSLT